MSVGGKVEVCACAATGAPSMSAQAEAVSNRRWSKVELNVIIRLFLPGIVPGAGDMTVTATKRFRAVAPPDTSTVISAV